jgi:YggT family protein
MFLVGNFLGALASVLDIVLNALLLIIVINALLSWVRPDPHQPIVMLLDRISDFVCDPIRRLVPTTAGGIDFAPFLAMLLIVFVERFAIGSLRDLAFRLG